MNAYTLGIQLAFADVGIEKTAGGKFQRKLTEMILDLQRPGPVSKVTTNFFDRLGTQVHELGDRSYSDLLWRQLEKPKRLGYYHWRQRPMVASQLEQTRAAVRGEVLLRDIKSQMRKTPYTDIRPGLTGVREKLQRYSDTVPRQGMSDMSDYLGGELGTFGGGRKPNLWQLPSRLRQSHNASIMSNFLHSKI